LEAYFTIIDVVLENWLRTARGQMMRDGFEGLAVVSKANSRGLLVVETLPRNSQPQQIFLQFVAFDNQFHYP
jgi:hypothetical protein